MSHPNPHDPLIKKLRYAFKMIGLTVSLKEHKLDLLERADFKSVVTVMPEGLYVDESTLPSDSKYNVVEPIDGDVIASADDFGILFPKLAEIIINSRLDQYRTQLSVIDDPEHVPSLHTRRDMRL